MTDNLNYIKNDNVLNDEELLYKYESELDEKINFDNYLSKDEYKQIIRNEDNVKILKKVTINFKDGNSRLIILSKTIPINKSV